MKSAENLLRALTRAILANPDLEPEIVIEADGHQGRMFRAEIDARPFDPAPLIGTGGTMKFAIQTVLAANHHPALWDIVFGTSGRIQSPRLRDLAPQTEPMKTVVDAAVNHWRACGRRAEGSVECSATATVAILTLDESLANAQRGAISRLARAIGKANGYRAAAIIEKLAVAV